ncbi:hypothetical protein [Algoriphagus sp. NG3]|uniref:hypothetical protein n=1 Tax=Algoriphagus sp. NG3 TaxID=3097546 RepID=UPI002A80E3D4|nr:hypothetical protein [Algoriphagus sp. NG3]WPR77749.1 hypothetical protein SLW71_10375 [Algoriphagus sp. NG3]
MIKFYALKSNPGFRLFAFALFAMFIWPNFGYSSDFDREASVVIQDRIVFQDSLSAQKARRDLFDVEQIVDLSNEQEVLLYKIFFDRHEYLKVPHTSIERTQLVLGALEKRFKEALKSDQIQALEDAGRIVFWFKKD